MRNANHEHLNIGRKIESLVNKSNQEEFDTENRRMRRENVCEYVFVWENVIP